MRDGRVESQEVETYLKQYVETAWDEPARLACKRHGQACRSDVYAVAVESFINKRVRLLDASRALRHEFSSMRLLKTGRQ
jgi:hypothetical protein